MTSIVTAAYTAAATYPLNHARVGYQSWTSGLSASSVAVSSELADKPRDGPLRADTVDKWKAVSGASTWRVDLGVARSVDYVGMVADAAGVQITVAYSNDDVAYTTFATAVTPTDGAPILLLDAAVSARYWRVSVASPVDLACVYIGQVLEMQRPFFDGFSPLSLSRNTDTTSSMTRGGQFIGQDIIKRGVSGSIELNNLKPGWYRANFDPLVRHLRTLPVFFAWNLKRAPDDINFCWSSDPIKPAMVAQTEGGRMSVSVALRGIGGAD